MVMLTETFPASSVVDANVVGMVTLAGTVGSVGSAGTVVSMGPLGTVGSVGSEGTVLPGGPVVAVGGSPHICANIMLMATMSSLLQSAIAASLMSPSLYFAQVQTICIWACAWQEAFESHCSVGVHGARSSAMHSGGP